MSALLDGGQGGTPDGRCDQNLEASRLAPGAGDLSGEGEASRLHVIFLGPPTGLQVLVWKPGVAQEGGVCAGGGDECERGRPGTERWDP